MGTKIKYRTKNWLSTVTDSVNVCSTVVSFVRFFMQTAGKTV